MPCALDIEQPDICYVGGLTRAWRVAKMAEAAGLVTKPHAANVSLVTVFTMHLLAALPKAPSQYSPVLNPKDALERRNLVLRNMWEEGYITEARYRESSEKPIKLNITTSSSSGSDGRTASRLAT